MTARRTILAALAALGLSAPAAQAAPLNDHFHNAKVLPAGSTSTTTYDLAGATKQPGEPSAGFGATGHTAWFKWTPAAPGGTSITACGNAFGHEVIEVYTGTSLADLTPVVPAGVTACAPDDVRFIAKAGTTYWIQADYDTYSVGPAHLGSIRVDQRTALPDTTLLNWPGVTGPKHVIDMAPPPVGISWFYSCTLDGQPLADCHDGDQLGFVKQLASGTHTFTAKARDEYGNVEAQPASRTWTVDATGPVTTITPPPFPLRTSTPAFSFGAEPGATFECRVGSAPYAPCSSPHAIAPVADGSYYLAVRAIDGFGNRGAPESTAFRVDTTTPPPPTTGKGKGTGTGTPTVTTPTGPGTTPTADGPRAPGAACRPRTSAGPRISRATLRGRGLGVRIAVATGCRIEVRLLAGGRTVARRVAVAPAGARVGVRLRAARRSAGRLVLRVVATDARGATTRTTQLVRVV